MGLSLFGGGGWVNPDALNESVVREAQANLEKLERSGRDELHLFVWIDSTMFSEEMAMYLRNVPPSGPSLPPSITIRMDRNMGTKGHSDRTRHDCGGPHLQAGGRCWRCQSSQRRVHIPPKAEACQALERTDQGYPPLVCGGSSIQRPPSSDTASLRRKKYGEWCDEGRRAEKSRRCSRSP